MNPELQLRDIHLPPEPSWWPPAPGWWLLAVLLVGLLVWGVRALLRVRRARRRQRALDAAFAAAVAHTDPQQQVVAISELLRRAARLRDPQAAALQGAAWLAFLNRSVPSADPLFSVELGQFLLEGPYRARIDANAAQSLIAPARRAYLHLVRLP